MKRKGIPRALGPLTLTLSLVFTLARAETPFVQGETREPSGPLSLQLRLIEVVPDDGATGTPTSGTARIEAVVGSHDGAKGLALEIRRPDGTPWLGGPAPFRPSRLGWIVGDSAAPRELPGDGSLALAPGQLARAILEVPLPGAAVHEIIVVVGAPGATGDQRVEDMVRVPLGVPMLLPVDDGVTADFKAVPSREVGR